MSELTPLARTWLDQLHRGPTVSTEVVARLLADTGEDVPDCWLRFHEDYGGYEEPTAGEVAVWGLALPADRCNWYAPGEVAFSRGRGAIQSSVACADVHPSHDYLLYADGHFAGPPFPCASFDVKVEREALLWDFLQEGPARRTYRLDGRPLSELRDALLEELGPFPAPSASDRFANYYRSADKLMIEALEHPTLMLVVREPRGS